MSDVLWIDGRFTTTGENVISVEDRGFQFADGVYEVFRFLGRHPVFLLDHFRRMASGLRAIEIPLPWTAESFEATIRELLGRTAFPDGIVYIQVTRGVAPRAHFWPDGLTPTALVYSRAFHFPDEAKKERGIAVITTEDLRWHRCDVKSTNILPNALAKKQAQRASAEEAVFLAGGFVREGASSSFFAVKKGGIITHPLDEHILPGVVREHVIELALSAKIRVDERPLRDAELFDLDEAFITSTTQGVMPVNAFDGRIIGNSRRGEITTTLQQMFDELERRRPAG